MKPFLCFLSVMLLSSTQAAPRGDQTLQAYAECLETLRATLPTDSGPKSAARNMATCDDEKAAFIRSHEDPELRRQVVERLKEMEADFIRQLEKEA